MRVTPDALRHVRGGHPWVFGDSITAVTDGGAPGDLAVIFDADRKFAAIGMYDPDSAMRIKVLHAGRPVTIDDGWWRVAFETALERRATFTRQPDADRLGYRIVNGENDSVPGLIVDRYAGTLVVKLYSAALFAHLGSIVTQLIDVTRCSSVVLRLARNLQRGETWGLADGDVVAGTLESSAVVFLEAGLEFEADVRHGQKTGWFLDQRANRITVGAMSAGVDVLDVFAAGGGIQRPRGSRWGALGAQRRLVGADARRCHPQHGPQQVEPERGGMCTHGAGRRRVRGDGSARPRRTALRIGRRRSRRRSRSGRRASTPPCGRTPDSPISRCASSSPAACWCRRRARVG